MSTVVISGPLPIVLPSELPGAYDDADTSALASIAAAQGRIDGPTGWVGRSFGVQTLDALVKVQSGVWQRLPFPPVIEIVSATDDAGASVSFEVDPVEKDRIKFSGGTGAVRVRYRAGYEWDEDEMVGTGKVPAQVKQAVIIGATRLLTINIEEISLRSDEVEGIGSDTFTVSSDAEAMVDRVMDNLLSGLRVITP